MKCLPKIRFIYLAIEVTNALQGVSRIPGEVKAVINLPRTGNDLKYQAPPQPASIIEECSDEHTLSPSIQPTFRLLRDLLTLKYFIMRKFLIYGRLEIFSS